MNAPAEMSDLERLVELEAIYRLKARRDHAVDQKDWETYAALHTDDYVAMSITATPIVGGSSRPRCASGPLVMASCKPCCRSQLAR